MKTRLTTLAASALLLHSATTFAASSVDLTVKGLIVPSACTPSLSGGGVIDHGKISAKDLNPDRATAIGVHTLSMTVNCDAPIQFALHPIDNRAGSGLSTDFGLGFINETQKLGHFSSLGAKRLQTVALKSNPSHRWIRATPGTPINSGSRACTWRQLRWMTTPSRCRSRI